MAAPWRKNGPDKNKPRETTLPMDYFGVVVGHANGCFWFYVPTNAFYFKIADNAIATKIGQWRIINHSYGYDDDRLILTDENCPSLLNKVREEPGNLRTRIVPYANTDGNHFIIAVVGRCSSGDDAFVIAQFRRLEDPNHLIPSAYVDTREEIIVEIEAEATGMIVRKYHGLLKDGVALNNIDCWMPKRPSPPSNVEPNEVDQNSMSIRDNNSQKDGNEFNRRGTMDFFASEDSKFAKLRRGEQNLDEFRLRPQSEVDSDHKKSRMQYDYDRSGRTKQGAPYQEKRYNERSNGEPRDSPRKEANENRMYPRRDNRGFRNDVRATQSFSGAQNNPGNTRQRQDVREDFKQQRQQGDRYRADDRRQERDTTDRNRRQGDGRDRQTDRQQPARREDRTHRNDDDFYEEGEFREEGEFQEQREFNEDRDYHRTSVDERNNQNARDYHEESSYNDNRDRQNNRRNHHLNRDSYAGKESRPQRIRTYDNYSSGQSSCYRQRHDSNRNRPNDRSDNDRGPARCASASNSHWKPSGSRRQADGRESEENFHVREYDGYSDDEHYDDYDNHNDRYENETWDEKNEHEYNRKIDGGQAKAPSNGIKYEKSELENEQVPSSSIAHELSDKDDSTDYDVNSALATKQSSRLPTPDVAQNSQHSQPIPYPTFADTTSAQAGYLPQIAFPPPSVQPQNAPGTVLDPSVLHWLQQHQQAIQNALRNNLPLTVYPPAPSGVDMQRFVPSVPQPAPPLNQRQSPYGSEPSTSTYPASTPFAQNAFYGPQIPITSMEPPAVIYPPSQTDSIPFPPNATPANPGILSPKVEALMNQQLMAQYKQQQLLLQQLQQVATYHQNMQQGTEFYGNDAANVSMNGALQPSATAAKSDALVRLRFPEQQFFKAPWHFTQGSDRFQTKPFNKMVFPDTIRENIGVITGVFGQHYVVVNPFDSNGNGSAYVLYRRDLKDVERRITRRSNESMKIGTWLSFTCGKLRKPTYRNGYAYENIIDSASKITDFAPPKSLDETFEWTDPSPLVTITFTCNLSNPKSHYFTWGDNNEQIIVFKSNGIQVHMHDEIIFHTGELSLLRISASIGHTPFHYSFARASRTSVQAQGGEGFVALSHLISKQFAYMDQYAAQKRATLSSTLPDTENDADSKCNLEKDDVKSTTENELNEKDDEFPHKDDGQAPSTSGLTSTENNIPSANITEDNVQKEDSGEDNSPSIPLEVHSSADSQENDTRTDCEDIEAKAEDITIENVGLSLCTVDLPDTENEASVGNYKDMLPDVHDSHKNDNNEEDSSTLPIEVVPNRSSDEHCSKEVPVEEEITTEESNVVEDCTSSLPCTAFSSSGSSVEYVLQVACEVEIDTKEDTALDKTSSQLPNPNAIDDTADQCCGENLCDEEVITNELVEDTPGAASPLFSSNESECASEDAADEAVITQIVNEIVELVSLESAVVACEISRE